MYIEKILEGIGLKMSEVSTLSKTDGIFVYRIFESVGMFAMYKDKNPELEKECQKMQDVIRKHLNSLADETED
ncbi:hypothetical protein AB0001_004760 [Salmonella enterica]|nr:hypothetical protein [Salmonella enterica]EEP3372992.1 hypothetical protein [Salmonella enterica]EFP6579699.1 hypothetical protein [Salmonella enterica]EGC7970981.1 hypothetical protein [Salmonella enterica]EIV4461164.1 hypothetical protein [Salmonella enterica]